MTNKEILKLLPRKKFLQSKKTLLEEKLQKLQKVLDILKQVNEVYKGIPVSSGRAGSCWYCAALDSSRRWGHVYQSTKNPKLFAVRIQGYKNLKGFWNSIEKGPGKHLGYNFTKTKALKIMKDWVALGVDASEQF